MKAGVAISPDTPSTAVTDEIAEAADMLLVMTVYPGRGGQKFLERCVPKVAELRARFPDKDIEVDGGVGPKTIDVCANAGELSAPSPSYGRPWLTVLQAAMSSWPALRSSTLPSPNRSSRSSRRPSIPPKPSSQQSGHEGPHSSSRIIRSVVEVYIHPNCMTYPNVTAVHIESKGDTARCKANILYTDGAGALRSSYRLVSPPMHYGNTGLLLTTASTRRTCSAARRGRTPRMSA